MSYQGTDDCKNRDLETVIVYYYYAAIQNINSTSNFSASRALDEQSPFSAHKNTLQMRSKICCLGLAQNLWM